MQVLTPLILVSDDVQTQTQIKFANVYDQTHISISTEEYYQFDMTNPQLDLRTSNNVKF